MVLPRPRGRGGWLGTGGGVGGKARGSAAAWGARWGVGALAVGTGVHWGWASGVSPAGAAHPGGRRVGAGSPPTGRYARRLAEVEAACNAMEDPVLHYTRPVPREEVEARVAFYLGPCWAECARDGGACPPEAEVRAVLEELGAAVDEPRFDRIQRFAPRDPRWAPPGGLGALWPTFLTDKMVVYGRDLAELIAGAGGGAANATYYVKFGDALGEAGHAFPFLAKARRAGAHARGNEGSCRNPVLLKMLRFRHYHGLTAGGPGQPFSERRDAAVWRGSTTGPREAYVGGAGAGAGAREAPTHPRASLVTRMDEWELSGIVDVGVVRYVQGVPQRWGWKWPLMGRWLAAYKMVIQVEGNDVASGLKWALLSGSAVVMPLPKVDSWAMESTLVPWVHYIPVEDDFSNLVERTVWCIDHPATCETIARQGACHMAKFLDEDADEDVVHEVIAGMAKVLAKYDTL